jgi:hypothetical protein
MPGLTRYDPHESSCQQPRALIRHLTSEQVRRPGRQPCESGSEHDANVPDVDGEVEVVEDVVDDTRGDHETRVDRTADDST